ncbi:MAG: helix-turn-helix domain-containing protein [Bacteroidetes bacterium]|nr:helix-turn-helix domain-containing protein [Bacteroidota bacterium]
MNTLRAIKTEKDHTAALGRMENIFDARPGSNEGNEAEVLMILISDYERMHYPVDAPTPVEAIKFRMEQLNLLQKDLAPYLGSATRVSEVLNGKRQLTLNMIAALHSGLGIPLASFLQTKGKERNHSED